MNFWDHLEELRKTLLQIGFLIFITSLLVFFCAEKILPHLLAPLQVNTELEIERREKQRVVSQIDRLYKLPAQATLLTPGIKQSGDYIELIAGVPIELEVTKKSWTLFSPLEGFLAACKLSLWLGVLVSSPFWMGRLLHFLLPALRSKEKRILIPLLWLSALFISSGVIFAYMITLPLTGRFFTSYNSQLGENLWGLGQSMDFSLYLILAHGIAFELYVGLLLLIHFGILTADQLIRSRRAMIVVILIVAAILTPPDVFSQVLLAIPMYILYELTLLYAKGRKKDTIEL